MKVFGLCLLRNNLTASSKNGGSGNLMTKNVIKLRNVLKFWISTSYLILGSFSLHCDSCTDPVWENVEIFLNMVLTLSKFNNFRNKNAS